MPIANLALGLKVASALFLVFTLLTGFQIMEQGMKDLPDPEGQHREDKA